MIEYLSVAICEISGEKTWRGCWVITKNLCTHFALNMYDNKQLLSVDDFAGYACKRLGGADG